MLFKNLSGKSRFMKRLFFLSFLSLASFCLSTSALQADQQGKIYWTDAFYLTVGTNKIRRANLDGSNPEDIVTGLGFPRWLALDETGGKMYWTEGSVGSGIPSIQRANLDGSDIQNLVTTGLIDPRGIDLDTAGGKVYWADCDTLKIKRANLDGTDVEDIISMTSPPWALALDVFERKIYVSVSRGYDAKIMRVDFDGSNLKELLNTGAASIRGLELDLRHSKMYWAQLTHGVNMIVRSNLDGTDVERLVEGLVFLYDLALDLPANKMYWVIPPHGSDPPLIQRANLDGSNVETVVSDGLIVPRGIEVISSHKIPKIVSIDIRPASCFNPLNLRSNGILPIAVLGTEDFDVNDIDIASVRLADVAPFRSNYQDITGPESEEPNACGCADTCPDGYTDLMLKFRASELAEALTDIYGQITKGDELELTLTGQLHDGSLIEGLDYITVVGKVPYRLNNPDLNNDQAIDFLDFAVLAEHWLKFAP
jgi:hypothetical protein